MNTFDDHSKLLSQLLKEPAIKYAPENQLALFSEAQLLKGEVFELVGSANEFSNPQLMYEHPNGKIYVGDSIKWLMSLEDETVDLIVADPPYNILDCCEFSSCQKYSNRVRVTQHKSQ